MINFPLGDQTVAFDAAIGAFTITADNLILENGTVENETAQETTTGTGTEMTNEAEAAEQKPGGFFENYGMMIVIYGAVILGFYFLMIRPQRKQQKKAAEMQDSLKIGDNIVTNNGFYGKIVELGTDAHVIEFGSNRGVRIPVRKSEIAGIKEPVLTPPPVV